MDAAYQAMLDGITKYTAVPGIKSVREAIAEDFTRKLGCKVEFEQVVVTGGAVMAIEATLRSICDPGDEVLVPDPSWPVYTMCVLGNHLVPKHYVMRAENAFEPTREDLERLHHEEKQKRSWSIRRAIRPAVCFRPCNGGNDHGARGEIRSLRDCG